MHVSKINENCLPFLNQRIFTTIFTNFQQTSRHLYSKWAIIPNGENPRGSLVGCIQTLPQRYILHQFAKEEKRAYVNNFVKIYELCHKAQKLYEYA
jgi:hypothetical protein